MFIALNGHISPGLASLVIQIQVFFTIFLSMRMSQQREADAGTWAAVLWQTVGNSLFGYAMWGWLLARYPAATVTPMALLVPVFGMAASNWWLGEAMPAWKLIAMALVMGGLAMNLLRREG